MQRFTSIRCNVVFAALGLTGWLAAQAMASGLSFDIAAGAATSTLKQFASQAHVQLLFDYKAVQSLKTPAVKGQLTPIEALKEMLDGSRFTFREINDHTIAVISTSQSANPGPSGVAPHDGDEILKEGTKRSSDGFRLAQVDQGQAPGTTSVEPDKKAEQRKPPELETILVTGTHIQGSTNPTAPVIVIDRADIERSGYVSTQQFVASIPQNFGGGAVGATEDGVLGPGQLVNVNDTYGTAINLRGLGASSTLVLVNGHRLAPSSDGIFVDVSTIPLAAIDRVEIMTDGASAIYGADAVAGVVNFILRKNYDGQETWATYGSGTDGTRPQGVIGQAVGRDWSGGNAVGTFQYQKLGALSAADRTYTDTTALPTDLLPKSEQYSASVNARQELGSGFDVTSDVLYSHANRSGGDSYPSFGTPNPVQTQFNSSITNAGVATIDLGYQLAKGWRIDASGSYSGEHTKLDFLYVPQLNPSCGTGPCVLEDNFNVWSGDIVADGTLFQLPGGDVKAALGGSYRKESLDYVGENFTSMLTPFSRHVTAGFAELELPVFGAANAQTLLRELSLALAVRHDNYSDFGGTTNPRYGLSWRPLNGLHVRAAYSTSFRAPTAFEYTDAAIPASLVQYRHSSPAGGFIPVFFQSGGGPAPQPEKSRNDIIGLEFEPPAAPDFKMSVDYFDIRYQDRIIYPSFTANALSMLDVYGTLITQFSDDAAAQSYINKIESEGGAFHDFYGAPGVGVRYLLNAFEQNAALERISGFDLVGSYHFDIGGHIIRVGLNGAYIAHIETSYTATTVPTDVVNTYANPLHWRARGTLGWSKGAWSINTVVNYSDRYTDTTTTLYSPISSWTTVDAQIAYTAPFAKGLALSLSGSNVFNRNPPYVSGQDNAIGGIHYDVGNGNPLGRVIALSARLAW